jgi:hypothetical protein
MLQSIAEALRYQLKTEYFKNFEIDVLSPICVKIARRALKLTSLGSQSSRKYSTVATEAFW